MGLKMEELSALFESMEADQDLLDAMDDCHFVHAWTFGVFVNDVHKTIH